ncbi:MAG: response regulator [Butyrivibrio sp.]|nr:response regulator [Butyrivibrio sp.]
MSKAVLVTSKFSIVLKGIEKKLKELDFDVKTINGGLGAISEKDYDAELLLLYMTDEILNQTFNLEQVFNVCQKAKHNGCGIIFVDGEQNYHEFIKVVPELNNYGWVNVPLDSKKFLKTLESELHKARGRMDERSVLIVDDDEVFGSMVKDWLKDEYSVSYLAEGKKVMPFLGSNKVDLILLDYEMPVMNGPEVLELLHSNPGTKNIFVIFLTGVNDRESIEKVLKLRPNGYLLKTATKEEILKKIGTFLKKNQQ